MEQESGKLLHSIGLDLTDLKKDANQAKDLLGDIGKTAVVEGDKIDKAFRDSFKRVKEDLNDLSIGKGFSTGMQSSLYSVQNLVSGNEVLSSTVEKVNNAVEASTAVQEIATLANFKAATQTGLLSTAKTIYTAVLTRLTTALRSSTVAAQAFSGALSMGLSVAIGVAMAAWERYNQKQEEAKKLMKERLEIERTATEQLYKGRLELDNNIRSIEQFTGTKEQEKQKISELNSKYGETFGHFQTLDGWYNALINRGADYAESLYLQAKAQEVFNRAIKSSLDADEIKKSGLDDYAPWYGDIAKAVMPTLGTGLYSKSIEAASQEKNKQEALRRAEAKRLEDEGKSILDQVRTLNSKNDFGFHADPSKGGKATGSSRKDDPFIKSLEDRKKQYAEYSKFLYSSDKDISDNAKQTFANLLKGGETYLQYLAKQREKLIDTLTKDPDNKTASSNLQSVRSAIADLESNNDAKELAERTKQLLSIEKQQSEFLTESQLNNSQARINAMEDGFDKEMAQIELNFQKEQQENAKRLQRAIELEKSRQEELWKAANPEKAKRGEKFDSSHITAASLPIVQLSNHTEATELTSQKRLTAEKTVLEKMLKEFQTFEEKRTSITDKYIREREELLKAGIYDDNREKLISEKETEALNALDLEAAKKNEVFRLWMNQLSGQTLQNLEKTLYEAEAILSTLIFNGYSEQDLATARARVETAKKAVQEARTKKDNAPEPEARKSWEVLADTIHNTASAIDGVADSFTGTTQEALKTAATVLNTTVGIIDAIQNLASSTAKGIQGTATAAAAAISTAEKASVILTVISLAVQAVTALINFSKKQAERVRETAVAIRDLNIELDRLARKNNMNSSVGIFGADKWLQAQKNVRGLNEAFKDFDKTLDKVFKAYGTSQKGLEHLMNLPGGEYFKEQYKGWDIREAILADTNLLMEKNGKKLIEIFPQLFKDTGIDYEMLGEFINSEIFGKLSLDVQDYLIEVKEKWDAYQDYLTALKEYLSDIFGELGNQMSDAMVDAFKNGESAAEAFTESVSKMLEQLAKQMIYSVTLAPIIKKAEEDFLKIQANSGLSDGQKFEQFSGVLGTLVDEAVGQQDNANALFKKYQDIAKEKGFDIFGSDNTRTGSQKGIAQASQDSVDELNGRFTAVQGHTSVLPEMNASLKLGLTIWSGQLRHLQNIDSNTSKLISIESDMRSVKNTLSDIENKGLKLR
jgi:hypothetical protein